MADIISVPHTGGFQTEELHQAAIDAQAGRTGIVTYGAFEMKEAVRAEGAPSLLIVDYSCLGAVSEAASTDLADMDLNRVPTFVIYGHGGKALEMFGINMNIVTVLSVEEQANDTLQRAITAYYDMKDALPEDVSITAERFAPVMRDVRSAGADEQFFSRAMTSALRRKPS